MSLSDADIERFARHIVLPEVGSRGQRRLLDACCEILGNDESTAAVKIYAQAGGLSRGSARGKAPTSADVVIVAEPCVLADEQRRHALGLEAPIVWFTTTDFGFRAGVRPAGSSLARIWPDAGSPAVDPPKTTACIDAHRVAAAADAVVTACAIVLGLPYPKADYEVRLA